MIMILIDKDTLVAEIKKYCEEYLKRAKIYVYDANYWIGKADAYHSMLEIIDTFEVKEVDLEKELDSMITPELKKYKALPSLIEVAKHFFELGMRVSNKLQKGEKV